MRIRFLLTCLGILVNSWGLADEPTHTPTDPAVREAVTEWVKYLSSPDARERSRAMQQLTEQGPPILPWLPAPDDIDDPALRDSLSRLRTQLERELAKQSVEASQVSFEGPLALETLLPRIEQQTGNRLLLPANGEALSNQEIQWQRVPFWTAVGELEQKVGKIWTWDDQREAFAPTGKATGWTVATAGPIRLWVKPARLAPLPDAAQRSLLRCAALVQVEPRLRPLFARITMSEWSAQAGNQPLPPWNPEADYELAFPDRTSEIAHTFSFLWPEIPPQEWELKGKLVIHLAAGREELTFAGPNLRRGVSERRGGVEVGIREARFQPDENQKQNARVKIVVNYDRGGPAFESHRVGLFHRSAWLTDRQGLRIPAKDFEINAEVDGGLVIEYRFVELAGRPVDYQFTYEAPTLLLDLPVEFAFSQLPAPELPSLNPKP